MPDPQGRGVPRADSSPLADAYKSAAEVGRQSVADQVSELDAIRNRAATFLAFVGSATAFLVGTAIRGSSGSPKMGFIIMGLFGSIIFVAIFLLFSAVQLAPKSPWKPLGAKMDWDSRQSGAIYAEWLSGDLPEAAPNASEQFYRHMANMYEDQFETNAAYLSVIQKRYVLFMAAGFAALGVWAIAAWLFGIG